MAIGSESAEPVSTRSGRAAAPGPEDALYDLEPSAFTTARNRLAKELKQAGDAGAADRVAKLSRPSITAWALNRVARSEPGAIDALLSAGGDLREAMRLAMSGDASRLRLSQAAERRTADAVIARAESFLEDTGHRPSDALRQRLAATLHAAVLDTTISDQLRAGCLHRDHDASGLGLSEETVPLPPAPRATTAGRAPDKDGEEKRAERREQADRQKRAERQKLAERAALAARAQARADRLEREATRLEEQARQARMAADEAGAEARRLAQPG